MFLCAQVFKPVTQEIDISMSSFSSERLLEGCGRARLAWANGALAFVNASHAWMLKELVKHYPDSEGVDKPWMLAQDDEDRSEEVQLMSKYVMCSPEYSKCLKEALRNMPNGRGRGGREWYLMNRASTVVATRKILLPDVGVTERGRTPPLTIEGTKHQLLLITVDGRDDIVKWKLGLFNEFSDLSTDQQRLHEHIEYEDDGALHPALPEWAQGAIVFAEKGAASVAEKIITSNGIVPRRGDIIISPIHTDIVWRLLRAELSDFVYLYTIKGNLRYRIEKLGIEEGYERSDEQKLLCQAADMQRHAVERMELMYRHQPTIDADNASHMRSDAETSDAGIESDVATIAGFGIAVGNPAVRSWTHPYACPTCGLAYMKWGLCYAHMGNVQACSGPLRRNSLEELQIMCRSSEGKAEGSPSDIYFSREVMRDCVSIG